MKQGDDDVDALTDVVLETICAKFLYGMHKLTQVLYFWHQSGGTMQIDLEALVENDTGESRAQVMASKSRFIGMLERAYSHLYEVLNMHTTDDLELYKHSTAVSKTSAVSTFCSEASVE